MADDLHPVPESGFDASNPEQIAKRKISAARREKELREVIVSVMSSAPGRNWMWSLMEACHAFQAIPPGDTNTAFFMLGERNIGLRLLAEISAATPDLLTQMLREKGQA